MLPLRRVVCCLCSTAIVVGILFCTLVETSEIDNNDEQQWTTYNNSNRRKKKCFHIYLPRSVCLLLSSSCHSRILASPNPLIQYTLLPRLAPSQLYSSMQLYHFDLNVLLLLLLQLFAALWHARNSCCVWAWLRVETLCCVGERVHPNTIATLWSLLF